MAELVEIAEPIVLIGPMKAGKTTIGKLLAERLSCSFVSLDRLEQTYTQANGFDEETAAELRRMAGGWARYSYRRQFFAEAIVQFLAEHDSGVLELGGGHPILPDAEQQTRVAHALAPLRYVVLLLPSMDRLESLSVLKSRQKPEHLLESDWNEEFLKDDRFVRLAKHIIYTAGKSPEETCEEIITWIVRQG